MIFFAVFLAFLLEQARPLAQDNPVHRGMRSWARWVRHVLDAGQKHHGWLSWSLATVLPALLSALVYAFLLHWLSVLAFAWLVMVLYATLGFRQFSHHFTAIRDALEEGNEEAARAALAQWRQLDASLLPKTEILRHALELSLVKAHRHVFGVLACFVLFSLLGLGPAGAVLYRMAEYLSRVWQVRGGGAPSEALRQAAAKAWYWIDYLPSRLTALCFAVVGNFEEAVSAWRQDARRFPDPNDGVVLAAASGAINVRLGSANGLMGNEPGSTQEPDGRDPQLAHLTSVVGLVWRCVVLWLLLMALMMVARLAG